MFSTFENIRTTLISLNMCLYLFARLNNRICNPGVAGSIFGRGVISPWQLISDIESDDHFSLIADSEVIKDEKSITCGVIFDRRLVIRKPVCRTDLWDMTPEKNTKIKKTVDIGVKPRTNKAFILQNDYESHFNITSSLLCNLVLTVIKRQLLIKSSFSCILVLNMKLVYFLFL